MNKYIVYSIHGDEFVSKEKNFNVIYDKMIISTLLITNSEQCRQENVHIDSMKIERISKNNSLHSGSSLVT